MRVESLRPLPRTLISEMLILKNGKVERIRNTQIPVDPNLPEPDSGFLTTITEEFGDEFEIVQAVSFPLLAAAQHKGMTLYDFKRK